MIYIFDLDGTLCQTPGIDYKEAVPIPENIARVIDLRRQGHNIVIWTARGSLTGIDWRELTERQLKAWKIDYDDLRFRKPYGDVYVDDKAFRPDERWPGEPPEIREQRSEITQGNEKSPVIGGDGE